MRMPIALLQLKDHAGPRNEQDADKQRPYYRRAFAKNRYFFAYKPCPTRQILSDYSALTLTSIGTLLVRVRCAHACTMRDRTNVARRVCGPALPSRAYSPACS